MPGFMSQLAMTDLIIWLDDVNFFKVWSTNGVQLKNKKHINLLSIPLQNKGKDQVIKNLKT